MENNGSCSPPVRPWAAASPPQEWLRALTEQGQSLMVCRGGALVYCSTEAGLRPLVRCLTQMKAGMRGASVADKAVGYAAALLLALAGVAAVATPVVSEPGAQTLGTAGIRLHALSLVPRITTREGALCPMESLALRLADGELLLRELLIRTHQL